MSEEMVLGPVINTLDKSHGKDRKIQCQALGPIFSFPLCDRKCVSNIQPEACGSQQDATHGTEIGFQRGGDRVAILSAN